MFDGKLSLSISPYASVTHAAIHMVTPNDRTGMRITFLDQTCKNNSFWFLIPANDMWKLRGQEI